MRVGVSSTCGADLLHPTARRPDASRARSASIGRLIARLGPEPLLQVAHDGLVVLRQETTDPRKARALDAAIAALQTALAPSHWVDPFHVTRAGGLSVLSDTALALAHLAPYRSDPAVLRVADQILGADLELARTAFGLAGHPGW